MRRNTRSRGGRRTRSSERIVVFVAAVIVVEVVLLHVGVLCSQSWYGDLVEEELSLVWTDGRVELIDWLTPVILLTQLLQNLTGKQKDRQVDGERQTP